MPLVIAKTVSSSATPEALGVSTQKFKGVVFIGCKGTAETNNTGNVYVQMRAMSADGTQGDWVSAMKVATGNYSAAINQNTLGNNTYNASEFKIKVDNNGDGVVAIVFN